MRTWRRSLILLLAMVTAGCSSLFAGSPTPPAAVPTTQPEVLPTPGSPAAVTPTAEGESRPGMLTVWLPPEFDPQSGSQAGNLLRERLKEFSGQEGNPEVTVRIKALTGQASLLESLIAARPAAPGALPDLVALNHANLQTAALKGLIYPFEGISQEIDDPDWFDYARQLGIMQGTNFGLPFAGDALALFYRPARVPDPIAGWDGLVRLSSPMAFAAADPQGMLTLALYEGAGGSIQDGQGRPALDAAVLARVLKYYQQGFTGGLFPAWMASMESEEQAWQAYQEERAHLVAAWISDYLHENPPDTSMQPMPSAGEGPFTLARGWSWALASPDPEQRAAAARLAEFLVEGQYLAQWTEAAGYLPTRPTSLAAWEDQGMQAALSQVILSAAAEPLDDILLALGPVLKTAALQMLRPGADAVKVAEAAASQLITP